MNDEMQKILIDIFPLIVEVNFSTEYKVNWDIQPVWFEHHQIWYEVSNNYDDFGHTRTAFWNDEPEFKRKMAEFKNELLIILGRG